MACRMYALWLDVHCKQASDFTPFAHRRVKPAQFFVQLTVTRTIFYATHIFDHLADWATHVLYFCQGKIECCCPLSEAWHKLGAAARRCPKNGYRSLSAHVCAVRAKELAEYHTLVAQGTRCPLYALMKLGEHVSPTTKHLTMF